MYISIYIKYLYIYLYRISFAKFFNNQETVCSMYSVYTFAMDIVAFSITVVQQMQYCIAYFCKVQ